MRLVIQRVTSAQVSTTERGVIGAIGKGLCVLVGIGHGDGDKEVEWAIKNLLNIKFWPNDEDKPWKVDVVSGGHSVLLVSQFTLYGQVYKKGRLDFHNAMPPTDARMLYDKLVGDMRRTLGESRTQSGEFGAMMEVSIVNDGPVTTIMDSPAPPAATPRAAPTVAVLESVACNSGGAVAGGGQVACQIAAEVTVEVASAADCL